MHKLRKQGRTKHPVRKIQQMELRQRIYQLRMEGRNEYEIAAAVGRTQGRVSQILNKEVAVRAERCSVTEDQYRAFELQRCESLISRGDWFMKAATSPRVADTLLQWSTRMDRLRGVSNNHTLSVNGQQQQPNPNEPPLDLTLLTEAELAEWERLYLKAQGREPDPDLYPPPYQPPPPARPAAVTDDRNVIAVIDQEQTLGEKIMQQYKAGQSPEEIRASLNLSHAEFLAAIESKAPRNGSAVQ